MKKTGLDLLDDMIRMWTGWEKYGDYYLNILVPGIIRGDVHLEKREEEIVSKLKELLLTEEWESLQDLVKKRHLGQRVVLKSDQVRHARELERRYAEDQLQRKRQTELERIRQEQESEIKENVPRGGTLYLETDQRKTNNDRITIIEICKRRGIKELVHFTPAQNLSSILSKGIMSRQELDKNMISYTATDYGRWDYCLNSVSLSVSFPNYQMFFSKRHSMLNTSQWVILSLSTEILWSMDCAFCEHNAASRYIRNTGGIEARKNLECFVGLFDDYDDNEHCCVRNVLQIPDSFTTNPQAEVLAFGTVAPEHIQKVYFSPGLPSWGEESWNQKPILEVRSDLFDKRCDWEHWRR